MAYAIQWLRSLLYTVQVYVMMAVIATAFAPWAVFDKRGAFGAIYAWCRWARWSASWMIGLKSEVRGTVPDGDVMIASKHQSFFDIILLCSVVRRPKFIMKKQLKWTPLVGWYAKQINCVAVDRGKRGAAIRAMVEAVKSGAQDPGQLIIFPQGTRVEAGVRQEYKVGVGVLYQDVGSPCVPVACNVGVFWPRQNIYRKPGLAVIEFLPTIAPGLPIREFMAQLETTIEAHSDALMAEAGFVVSAPPRV